MYGNKRGRKSYKRPAKMPKKAKILAEKPKAAIRDIEKQITVLMKRTRLDAPEVKFLDGVLSQGDTYGADLPFQNVVIYPAQGTGQGQRIGEKIKSLRLHLIGDIFSDNNSQFGQVLHMYILQSKLNTTGSWTDARNDFIIPDQNGDYSTQSLRSFERMKLWKVLHKKTFTLAPPQFEGTGTNWVRSQRTINCTFAIPAPEFDSGILSTDINSNAVQLLMVSSFGWAATVPYGGALTTSGFRMNLKQRLYYTDA